MPKSLAKIHPRYLTPSWATWWFGIASVVWWVILIWIDRSENILRDSISGLGFAIAFYYGITALASPVLFRRILTTSVKRFVMVGLVPFLGLASLTWVFVRSAIDYWDPANSYTPPWFAFGSLAGIGASLVIGIGMLLIGIPPLLWARHAYRDYFRRKTDVAELLDEVFPDEFRVTEETTGIPGFEAPVMPKPKTPTR